MYVCIRMGKWVGKILKMVSAYIKAGVWDNIHSKWV